MSKKEITEIASRLLIILLMITFVISAVFPDISLEVQTVSIEEVDMDGQESNEEKKESKEGKENINHDIQGSIEILIGQESILKSVEHSPSLQDHYLPVITPPPDQLENYC